MRYWLLKLHSKVITECHYGHAKRIVWCLWNTFNLHFVVLYYFSLIVIWMRNPFTFWNTRVITNPISDITKILSNKTNLKKWEIHETSGVFCAHVQFVHMVALWINAYPKRYHMTHIWRPRSTSYWFERVDILVVSKTNLLYKRKIRWEDVKPMT